MRVSIDNDDPGYENYVKHRFMRVRLNGVEISHVVTADEEERLLVRYATDERGLVVLDRARPGELVMETLYGDVAIVPCETGRSSS